jgi:lipopolysaccharide export system protein LptA
MGTMRVTLLSAAVLLSALQAATPAAAQAPGKGARSFGDLGANKEPIKIDADRLDVFDKESKAVFAGNVVAVQGDTTMKCTTLTVYYEPRREGAAGARPAPAASASQQGAGDSQIRKIDCAGPVTIVSKTQTATGDSATFDRVANRVLLVGNVALSDGPNVTRGERLVYDLNTSVANVETAPGGRVKALFVPGSGSDPGATASAPAPSAAPVAAPSAAPAAGPPRTAAPAGGAQRPKPRSAATN